MAEEEAEKALNSFNNFQLSDDNDDLTLNVIRHFDFSNIGFFDEEGPEQDVYDLSFLNNLAQTSTPGFNGLTGLVKDGDITNIQANIEQERGNFEMKVLLARDSFSQHITETKRDDIGGQLQMLDQIIDDKGTDLSQKLDAALASYEQNLALSSDAKMLGEALLAQADEADGLIDEYFDQKLVEIAGRYMLSAPEYRQAAVNAVEEKRASAKAQVGERRALLVNDVYRDDAMLTAQCAQQCVDGYSQLLDSAQSDYTLFSENFAEQTIYQLQSMQDDFNTAVEEQGDLFTAAVDAIAA